MAVAVIMMVSCVKESRDKCPCYLNFAHDGFDNNGYLDDICLYVVNKKADNSTDTYRVEELIHDVCDVGVKRGDIDVYGLVGLSSMTIENSNDLIIPYGMQCDPLLAFYDDVQAYGERALVFGRINKQYAKVRVTLNIPDVEGVLAVKVTGNSCGMNMQTMAGIRGDFACLAESWENDLHVFKIPRQLDNTLRLEIWQAPDSGSCDIDMGGGRMLSFIEIGKIINDRLEYDWNAESLSDIDLSIDYVISTITVTIRDWGKEVIQEVEI